MTIYRGPGGTGSATSDADTTLYQDFLNQTLAARDAALQAEVNAELAETNAETAETNAETAETNAETAATNAASSASAAASSASSASTSASNASTSASAASTSATNAASSASSASSSATSAANSASTATTQASNASSSASAAASSASSAATSATSAANSASSASTSETNAANSATSASNSASSAATSATNAANSATSASNSASAAAASASEAAGYASSINPADLVHISGTETITGAKTFSTNPTLSAGTANGVAYLNGSKVLTTGSALTFDGSSFGVGTSTPSQRIDAQIATTTEGSGLAVTNSQAGGYGSGLSFYSYRTDGTTKVMAGQVSMLGAASWADSANSTSSMLFKTINAGTLSERMRLDSSGNLGIGTSSPGQKLAVIGTSGSLSNSSIRVNSTPGTQSANSGLWLSGNQSTSHYNWLLASQYNVNQSFEITPSTAVDGATFSNPVYTVNVAGLHKWFNGTTQAMTLDASGNLGVGTSSPTSKLQVSGTVDGAVTATISNNSTGASSLAELLLDGQGNNFYIRNYGDGTSNANRTDFISTAGSSYFTFSTSSTERARIDSSGNFIQSAPTTPPSLATNGTMVFNLTSNTNLRISVRGSDGVTRTANITLA